MGKTVNKKEKCESKNHKKHYGDLWQCQSCKKHYCSNEGTTDHPEVCDKCWYTLYGKTKPQKIVMYGLLVETKEQLKQLEDGFKELGFHKPTLVGTFKTLPGQGGKGGRSDVVVAINNKDIPKLAISRLHLNGGFSWEEDYLANNITIVPSKAYKFFNKFNKEVE